MNLTVLPTLDELAAHPERAGDLPVEVLLSLLAKCGALQTGLLGALFATSGRNRHMPANDDGERLLTVPEVAARIGMSPSWVEKHTADLPMRVSVAGNPRWRKSDLERWIKNCQQYGATR